MSQKTENTFVDRIIDVVIHRRRMVEKVFAVLVLLSIVANFFIPINYDLTEYLPDWAPTMQGTTAGGELRLSGYCPGD